MGAVARGETPAQEIVSDRMIELLLADKIEYPNELTFIASDTSFFGSSMRKALAAGKAILVVYPDGRERLIPAAKARRPRS
ncbi:MAG TPA: hypothetical protein VMS60_01500 [Solirubrobacterales bacterium]|nr:hypothetical protein [Solirubrobacterales bacterium]